MASNQKKAHMYKNSIIRAAVCLMNGGAGTHTLSDQSNEQLWAAGVGVACGNWRLLLGDRLYWARGRIGFSQRLDERLVDRNQDETEVVSSTFFNGSVFFFFFLLRICADRCHAVLWYSTLKLLMSLHFSQALVAWLLLFSWHQTWCKYRPPVVSKPFLTATQGSILLLFSQRVSSRYIGSFWGGGGGGGSLLRDQGQIIGMISLIRHNYSRTWSD